MNHSEKAREIMAGLVAINQHMGFQFTQPLMRATDEVANALLDAEKAKPVDLVGKTQIIGLQAELDVLKRVAIVAEQIIHRGYGGYLPLDLVESLKRHLHDWRKP